MDVTLILPVKNEEETLAHVLKASKPYADHILVVDGHSTDGTCRIAEDLGVEVIQDGGRGKGDGIRAGLAHARGDIFVLMDGDGSHDPSDIPRLVAPIQDGVADLVLASRMTGGSDELHGDFNNFVRMIGGALVSLCINLRWGTRITDALNGYRAIRAEAAAGLPLQAWDFDIEQEIVMKALKQGFRVTEVSSHEYARQGGQSKLPTFRRGHKFLWRLLWELL